MSGNSLALLVRQAQAIDGPLPCRREDPQLWFSDQPADLDAARSHCRPCPLRGLCLAGAIERRERDGVWGGEIFAHGTIIARKRPRGRPRRQVLRPGTAPAREPLGSPQAEHGSSGSSDSSAP
jgi:WhiB family transcriptional regulator, redox-sensing transcriptional regulator